MENAKVYININNPFVFTPFDGQDPQVGTDKKSYPSVTSYQLGLHLLGKGYLKWVEIVKPYISKK